MDVVVVLDDVVVSVVVVSAPEARAENAETDKNPSAAQATSEAAPAAKSVLLTSAV